MVIWRAGSLPLRYRMIWLRSSFGAFLPVAGHNMWRQQSRLSFGTGKNNSSGLATWRTGPPISARSRTLSMPWRINPTRCGSHGRSSARRSLVGSSGSRVGVRDREDSTVRNPVWQCFQQTTPNCGCYSAIQLARPSYSLAGARTVRRQESSGGDGSDPVDRQAATRSSTWRAVV